MKITDAEIREVAAEFLDDLDAFGPLEVGLVPAGEPKHSEHKIRVAVQSNPAWYSRFVAKYTNCRGRGRKRMIRPRTFINRKQVVEALRRIRDGEPGGIYVERLRAEIRATIERRKGGPEPEECDGGPMWF